MHPKRAVTLIKIETTYGTDPTPAADVNAIITSLPTIKPTLEQLARNVVNPTMSPLAPYVIGTEMQIDFEVEARPASAAGSVPEVGPLLRACGLDETISEGVSVTYAPVSQDHESVTIWAYRDGVRHKVSGCRGTVKLIAEVNKIAIWQFTFRGIYQAPDDTALASPTYTSIKPAIVRSADLSLTPVAAFSAGTGKVKTVTGGSTTITTTAAAFASVNTGDYIKANSLTRRIVSVAAGNNSAVVDSTVDWYNADAGYDWEYKDSWVPTLAKVELDLANELVQRTSIAAATGVAGIEISARAPKGTIDPEATLLADRNHWTAALAQTFHILALSFGASPGIDISCPKIAFNDIAYGERGARLTHDLPFNCEFDAGDDEITITF